MGNRTLLFVSAVVGVGMFIVGIPEIPESIRNWVRLLHEITGREWQWWNVVLCIAGLSIFLVSVYFLYPARSQNIKTEAVSFWSKIPEPIKLVIGGLFFLLIVLPVGFRISLYIMYWFANVLCWFDHDCLMRLGLNMERYYQG